MRYLCICLIAVFTTFASQGQKIKTTNKAAKNIYKKQLAVIGKHINFLKQKDNFTHRFPSEFNTSIVFLEGLTLINCDIFHSFESIGEPSQENYKDWKSWYRLNRKKLYLDAGQVKINGTALPVKKKSTKYYRKKLTLVKKSTKQQLFKDPEYSDAIYFLRDLTKIKRDKNQKKSDLDIPSRKELSLFADWLQSNKKALYWDVSKHTVKLR